jgi:hypothetical protein
LSYVRHASTTQEKRSLEMKWFRRWLRRRVLLHRLKSSDARYDILSAERDKLNALSAQLGGKSNPEIIEAYARLDQQDKLCEMVYIPIETELRLLDSASISRWLLYRSVDAVEAIAIAIVLRLPRIRRAMRRGYSRMKRQTKTPARPSDDEPFQTLLLGCAG